jgi:hypothetical protein
MQLSTWHFSLCRSTPGWPPWWCTRDTALWAFVSRIELAELLRIINSEATTRGTEIVAVDRIAESRARRSLWQNLEPFENEVKISEL